jgi:hypothetical protein
MFKEMKDILLKTYPHGSIVARYKLGGISNGLVVCHIIMIKHKKILGIFNYKNETELKPKGLINSVSLEKSSAWRDTDYVYFARGVESHLYELEKELINKRHLQNKFLNKFT